MSTKTYVSSGGGGQLDGTYNMYGGVCCSLTMLSYSFSNWQIRGQQVERLLRFSNLEMPGGRITTFSISILCNFQISKLTMFTTFKLTNFVFIEYLGLYDR